MPSVVAWELSELMCKTDRIKLEVSFEELIKENFYFKSLAKRSSFGRYLIVAGDLNTTPWAAPFMEFIKTMSLQDSRVGRGLVPTWPVFFPPLFIPIDHVLASDFIQINKLATASATGSDHLPLIMDFSL